MTKLPKAPKNEGVDPLTDGKRYHGEDVKAASEKARKEREGVNVDQKAQNRKKAASDSSKTTTDSKSKKSSE